VKQDGKIKNKRAALREVSPASRSSLSSAELTSGLSGLIQNLLL